MNLWRSPRTAVALLVTVGTLLLALVSAAGTSAVDFGVGWTPGYDFVPDDPPPASDENVDDAPMLVTAAVAIGLGITVLVWLLLFGLGLVVLIRVLRLQVLRWRRRSKAVQRVDEQDAEMEPGPGPQASGLVRRAARGALAELRARAGGPPADAVVAAWVVLEGASATAGSARQAHQTPTEFTAAVLAEHAVDPDALHRLRRLYQRARFGTATVLTETDVAAAESDLERLVGDLAGSVGDLAGGRR
jgi:hypothetical protein